MTRWPKHLLVLTNDSFGLVNEFVDPAGISGTDAAALADYREVAGTAVTKHW